MPCAARPCLMRGPNAGESKMVCATPPPALASSPVRTSAAPAVPRIHAADDAAERMADEVDARGVDVARPIAIQIEVGERAREREQVHRALTEVVARDERARHVDEVQCRRRRSCHPARRQRVVVDEVEIERALVAPRRRTDSRHRVAPAMPCSGRSMDTDDVVPRSRDNASATTHATASRRLRVRPCWKISTGQPLGGLQPAPRRSAFGTVTRIGIDSVSVATGTGLKRVRRRLFASSGEGLPCHGRRERRCGFASVGREL